MQKKANNLFNRPRQEGKVEKIKVHKYQLEISREPKPGPM